MSKLILATVFTSVFAFADLVLLEPKSSRIYFRDGDQVTARLCDNASTERTCKGRNLRVAPHSEFFETLAHVIGVTVNEITYEKADQVQVEIDRLNAVIADPLVPEGEKNFARAKLNEAVKLKSNIYSALNADQYLSATDNLLLDLEKGGSVEDLVVMMYATMGMRVGFECMFEASFSGNSVAREAANDVIRQENAKAKAEGRPRPYVPPGEYNPRANEYGYRPDPVFNVKSVTVAKSWSIVTAEIVARKKNWISQVNPKFVIEKMSCKPIVVAKLHELIEGLKN